MQLSKSPSRDATRLIPDSRRAHSLCQGTRSSVRRQVQPRRLLQCRQIRAQQVPSQPSSSEEETEGLTPDEDWTVPGGYQDSLSRNTQLGRAVDDACKELDTLGNLEKESLAKANDLLKKLGYKGDITAPEIPPKVRPEDARG